MKFSTAIGLLALPHGIANPVLNDQSQLKLTGRRSLANPFPMGFGDSDPELIRGRRRSGECLITLSTVIKRGRVVIRYHTITTSGRTATKASTMPTDAIAHPKPRRLNWRYRVAHQQHLPIAAFTLLVFLTIACWIQLTRWYSLSRRYDTDFFALEKLPGQFESPILRQTIWIFLVLGLCYAVGLWLLHRLPAIHPAVRAGIIASWLGPGICNVLIFPFGALDVFRYMIALKSAFYYHENPYVHGFMDHKFDDFAKHAFLLHLPNAKGPIWLWLSAIPAHLAGFDDQQRMLIALKLFNLLLVGLIGALLYTSVGGGKQGWIAFFLFSANPLVQFESVGVAHNDVMTAGLVVAALVALRRRSWLALPLIVAAALVKYFAFQLYPLFVLIMIARKWEFRRIAFGLAGSAAVTLVSIIPFWDGGDMLRGIGRVGERYESFPHVSLLSLERQWRIRQAGDASWNEIGSRTELFALFFIVLSLPFLWAAWKGGSPARAVIALYLLFLLFATLLYPWYLVPVVAVMGLTASRLDLVYLVAASTLGLLYYPFYVWAHFTSGLEMLETHLFLALFLTLPMAVYLLIWLGTEAFEGFRHFRQRTHQEQLTPLRTAD
ncbi:hypothetical protein BH23CHL4_BH23CHL4_10010 [soil metagenome]